MQVLLNIILTLCLGHLVVDSTEPEAYKLEQLQVLFRHGERTANKRELFVNDPNNEIYQKHGYGELTTIGKKRMYNLGQFLRKRYGAFLGEYRDGDVYAYSTDMDRNKLSLKIVLAGLYPPSPTATWSETIGYPPIPTDFKVNEFSFLSNIICPARNATFQESLKTPETAVLLRKYRSFYERIQNNTGTAVKELFRGLFVYNNLRCALGLGVPLPSWCSKEDFHELEKITGTVWKGLTRTESLRRLMAGQVVEHFLNVLKETRPSRKIHIYSGHETNLAVFVDSHNITGTPVVHDYGSALVLERLRALDNRVYLRIYLLAGNTERFMSLKLENCDRTCPLTDYERIVQPILPNEASRVPCYASDAQRANKFE